MRNALFLSLLAGLLAVPEVAAACSCVLRKPAEYMDAADKVFVGMAFEAEEKGEDLVQHFQVFTVLKGDLGRTFTLRRPSKKLSTCDNVYRSREVALVLVRKGAVSVCDGNYALSVQLPSLAAYVKHSKVKTDVPELAELAKAFRATLKPYLHKRKEVWVRHPPLDGKDVDIHGTTFHFVADRAKPDVRIDAAFSAGLIHFVDAYFVPEGVRSRVLMGHAKAGPEVLGTLVVEQDKSK